MPLQVEFLQSPKKLEVSDFSCLFSPNCYVAFSFHEESKKLRTFLSSHSVSIYLRISLKIEPLRNLKKSLAAHMQIGKFEN